MTQKIKIPTTTMMRAAFTPGSFNDEEKTVEVVWTTGAKVKRYTWTGSFMEELSLKKDHVKLDRLNNGAPVLNNHSSYDLRDSIGVVEKAWIKDKQGHAIIRFSSREDVQGIVKDVKDGIIRNISVGYKVDKFEDVTKKGDEIPTYRAVDWTPVELSFVNIPADASAQVRSEKNENEFNDVILIREEEIMDKEKEQTQTTEQPAVEQKPADPVVDLDAVRAEAEKKGQEKEMARQDEIKKSVTAAGLEDSVAVRLISEKKSVQDANAEVIRLLAEKNKESKTSSQKVEVNDVDNKQMRRKCAENAILKTYSKTHKNEKLVDGARQFMGEGILDICRRYLEADGVDTRNMTRQVLAKIAIGKRDIEVDGIRTHVSTDFPSLLADVTNKSLQRAYAERPQTFSFFVTDRLVNDFKTIQSTQFGDAPALEKVNEKGEYKEGTISEGKETYKLAKYGKILSVSEELLINDDLGAFLGLAEKMGRRSRDLESDLVWGIINANAAMINDNVALFHASHGNLAGAAAAIAVASVSAGRIAMRAQLGLDKAKLDLQPKYLVVPSALETVAEQFVGATVPQQDSNYNPFKTKLQVVSEIRLDDSSLTAWYLFADKSQCEMVEMSKLRGMEQPSIETKEAFESDAMKIKIKYHVAAKALDFRGFYKNAGV
jgi:hypothetical protein